MTHTTAAIILHHASLSSKFQDTLHQHLSAHLQSFQKKHNIDLNFDICTSPKITALFIPQIATTYTTKARTLRGPLVQDGPDALKEFLLLHRAPEENAFSKSTPQGEFWFVKSPESQEDIWPLFSQTVTHTLLNTPFHKRMYWSSDKKMWARPILSYQATWSGENVTLPLQQTIAHIALPSPDITATQLKTELEKKHNSILCSKERFEKALAEITHFCSHNSLTPSQGEEAVKTLSTNTSLPSVVFTTLPPLAKSLHPQIVRHILHTKAQVLSFADPKGVVTHFATITDGAPSPKRHENTAKGFTSVITAYLEDAAFFMGKDLEQPLSSYSKHLNTRLIHKDVGSMSTHISRMQQCAQEHFPNNKELLTTLPLLKCDLETLMVHEYPDLQGLVGSLYAEHNKAPKEVCLAIADHYKPLGPKDSLPTNHLGALCGILDKIGALANFCSIGYKPTSTKDPLGFRRIVLGILRTVQHHKIDCSVDGIFCSFLKSLNVSDQDITAHRAFLKSFTANRLQNFVDPSLLSILPAVTQHASFNQLNIHRSLQQLDALKAHENLACIIQGFKRASTLAQGPYTPTNEHTDPPSQPLEQTVDSLNTPSLNQLSQLAHEIHTLCDNNLVLCEDEKTRNYRKTLLARCCQLFNSFANFEVLSTD